MSDEIVSTGGICAPLYLFHQPQRRGDTFCLTYRVEGRLRRWWFRRTGWSTEWTVEHEYVLVRDMLPSFVATRGGIKYGG